MRIGIFGGSFNPPHVGHLIVAERVRESAGLSRVLFIPTATPPHKGTAELPGAKHRLAMVQLAVEGNPAFEVSDCEVRRGGVSYTIETLREMHRRFPTDDLYLIIGLDNFLEFRDWKDPEAVLSEAELIVMDRPIPGARTADSPYLDRAIFVEVPLIEISATMVRETVRAGKSIRYLVPEKVEAYIKEQGLYR